MTLAEVEAAFAARQHEASGQVPVGALLQLLEERPEWVAGFLESVELQRSTRGARVRSPLFAGCSGTFTLDDVLRVTALAPPSVGEALLARVDRAVSVTRAEGVPEWRRLPNLHWGSLREAVKPAPPRDLAPLLGPAMHTLHLEGVVVGSWEALASASRLESLVCTRCRFEVLALPSGYTGRFEATRGEGPETGRLDVGGAERFKFEGAGWAALTEWGEAARLRSLRLRCDVESLEHLSLRVFPRLETLDLSGCRRLRRLPSFEGAERLEVVDVRGTQVERLPDLGGAGRLRALALHGAPIEPEQVPEAQRWAATWAAEPLFGVLRARSEPS